MNDSESWLIRPMRSDDLQQVLEWRNHPDIGRYMVNQHEITPNEHRRWFERTSVDPGRRLLIVTRGHVSLGFVQFSDVSRGGVANWGFYSAPRASKGTGKKLGALALDLAFNDLGLHKVCGQALDRNEASVRLHLSLGFEQEGVLREQVRIGTIYRDLICFGLLGHEWRSTNNCTLSD